MLCVKQKKYETNLPAGDQAVLSEEGIRGMPGGGSEGLPAQGWEARYVMCVEGTYEFKIGVF